ncbi:MAG TPA: Druantia anti-phage system protein DruA [Spirochaetia bacterium]|nr:Druantia anti-phage system protein DruA [Spirochaetia bacterium]
MCAKKKVAETTPFRYCGRTFSLDEIECIRRITDDVWCTTRSDIARAVCKALHWVKPDGEPKLLTCKLALNRMEEHGVIWLPLPTTEPFSFKSPVLTSASEPQESITGSRGDLKDVHLVQVSARTDEARLWNELMERYHYLGGRPMAGAQIRYLAYDGDRPLGALGFGAAALKLAPRDRFIGWTATEREANIHLVVGNRRFLILPWVQVRGLASSLLSLVARRLPGDWQQRYAYTPVLLESFTEPGRVKGTSYAAANWLLVGQSQGRGRLAPSGQSKSIKDIWVYPLDKRFRAVLTGGRLRATQRQAERKAGDWALARSGGSPE